MPNQPDPSRDDGSASQGGPRKPAKRPCPICKRPVADGDKFFPFCTERCKTIDLARWATGDYVISRPIEQRDLDEE